MYVDESFVDLAETIADLSAGWWPCGSPLLERREVRAEGVESTQSILGCPVDYGTVTVCDVAVRPRVQSLIV